MFGNTVPSWRNASRLQHSRQIWRKLPLIAGCWIVMVAMPSEPFVRGWLCLPIYLHEEDARGDVAYVMAAGFAYYERLRAASDLLHMQRISEIYLLDEQHSAGYDFVRQRTHTKVEQATDYLVQLGVPVERIHLVPEIPNAWMGSLNEAQMFASIRPSGVSSVVVVTSAPHTRRSHLCFRRSLPSSVKLQVFSATAPAQSSEIYMPIWQEYFKLLVYSVLA